MFASFRCTLALLVGTAFTLPALAQSTLTRATTVFTGVGTYQPTVAFGNGTFVALGLRNTPPAAATTSISAHTSPDGDTWTERVVTIGSGFSSHGAVRFLNGRFVFAGTALESSGQRTFTASSADGITWTVATTPNSEKFADIVTGGATSLGFFATTLSTTTDGGATWTSRAAPGVTSTSPYMAAAYGNGRFVLVSTNRAWTSPDGATWTDIAGTQSSGRVAFGNGLFALTGTAYRTSTDGVTFTPRTPTGLTLTGTNTLRFAAGRFLYHQFTFSGITPINQIIASADGITWTPFASYPTGAIFNMNDVAEGNNRLVVVGFTQTQVPIAAFLDTRNLPALPTPPAIAQPPAGTVNAVAGGTATFSVTASGAGNTYQWRKDNVALPGATAATLTLNNVTAANAGVYTVVITNSLGSITSSPSTLALVAASAAGRLVNMSIRTNAGTGDNTLIVGIGLGGAGTSGEKAILIRGVGPTLATSFGLGGALADPVMIAYQGQTEVDRNDDWNGNFNFASVGAFAFAGNPVRDAGIYAPDADPGSYSIQITGKNNATGIALAEIYDATPGTSFTAATPRLINVSARTSVGTGDNILIAGFAIGGQSAVRVLIRAVGPTLGGFGVGGTLADPKLEIFNGSTKTAENDNWSGTAELKAAFSSVAAFAYSADSSRDAALVTTLPPGSYTAQISGVNNTSGVALVEIYELP